MTTNILYIHGFNSSPLSYKAQATKAYVNQHYPEFAYHCPALNVSPKIAMQQLEALLAQYQTEHWYLLGSSLGGYYAHYLAEKYDLPAVLINPAVMPYELLQSYLGEQKNYHTGQIVTIKPSFMAELKQLEMPVKLRKNLLLMLQTGDEVLDYRQAQQKFSGCECILEQGGDHSFVNFEQHFVNILQFFKLTKDH